MSEIKDGAVEIRDEFETAMAAMQAVVNKLNQLIDEEITEDEYKEWVDNNDELFQVAEF